MNGGGGSWPCQPRDGEACLRLRLPLCFLETESLPPQAPCRTRSRHPRPLWAPEVAQRGYSKMDKNLHPPARNGWHAGTRPSLRAGPNPRHCGNAAQGRGWPPGASQNLGSSGLSSAAPSGSGGPKRPPSGAQPALHAGSEHPSPPALQTRSGALCQPGGLLMSLIPSTCPRPQPRDAHG